MWSLPHAFSLSSIPSLSLSLCFHLVVSVCLPPPSQKNKAICALECLQLLHGGVRTQGDRDPSNQDKEKRGVCSWPDPPEVPFSLCFTLFQNQFATSTFSANILGSNLISGVWCRAVARAIMVCGVLISRMALESFDGLTVIATSALGTVVSLDLALLLSHTLALFSSPSILPMLSLSLYPSPSSHANSPFPSSHICFQSQIPGEFNDLFFHVSVGHLSETGELEGYGVYHYSSIGAHPHDRFCCPPTRPHAKIVQPHTHVAPLPLESEDTHFAITVYWCCCEWYRCA